MPYRIASSILGIWLVVSVFCWHHAPERGFADFAVGITLFLSGFSGLYLRAFRFFDGLLGLWMVGSFFLLRAEHFPGRLHDALLGLVVLALASIPGKDAALRHDHWISDFDLNPGLERRSLIRQELEG